MSQRPSTPSYALKKRTNLWKRHPLRTGGRNGGAWDYQWPMTSQWDQEGMTYALSSCLSFTHSHIRYEGTCWWGLGLSDESRHAGVGVQPVAEHVGGGQVEHGARQSLGRDTQHRTDIKPLFKIVFFFLHLLKHITGFLWACVYLYMLHVEDHFHNIYQQREVTCGN